MVRRNLDRGNGTIPAGLGTDLVILCVVVGGIQAVVGAVAWWFVDVWNNVVNFFKSIFQGIATVENSVINGIDPSSELLKAGSRLRGKARCRRSQISSAH